MKTLAFIFAAFLLASCAEFAGNGVSVGVSYEDPENGVKVDVHTAK